MSRTIEQNLTLLSSTKKNIRNAINIKGGSVSSATPFADYATAISNLPSGGGGEDLDWSLIGYSARPSTIDDDYAYARQIYVDWDASQTNLMLKFSSDKQLVYMPLVDTSNATDMYGMFNNCSRLTIVPLLNTSGVTRMYQMFSGCISLTTIPLLNTSACGDMGDMFSHCHNLTAIPLLNTSACTNMHNMFSECYNLTTIPLLNTSVCIDMGTMFSNCSGLTTVPELNTSACRTMQMMFTNCKKLEKIGGLDLTSVTNISNFFGFSNNTTLRYALFKNLGTPSNMTSYDFSKATNWGVADSTYTDARQSLVDSLLTYSFDRATAGYSTCTIKLSADSKNQLTAQEITDIEAKGYTITT